MINRRQFLGITAGAGATLALTPELLRALQRAGVAQRPDGSLIRRAIPSTGEMIPATGLSFSNHPSCSDPAALKAVLKSFVENGGRVFDAMHVSPDSERFHASVANELGVQDKLFWSTRGTPPNVAPTPGAGATVVPGHVASLLARLNVPKIDLVMLPPQLDPTYLTALKAEKAAGRVRYIGVQVIGDPVYPQLESVMRSERIDFIGVDYDVGNRARVEDTILPLAQERKIGVMAFFPFGNAGGLSCTGGTSLFSRVAGKPVPDWAAEFDAKTWAQFFLKYVLGHPAITVARVGTTKPQHMLDNLGGGIGRLPDEATRRRMAAFIDALPAAPPPSLAGAPQAPGITLPAAILDRYVAEYKAPSGFTMTFRRDGDRLLVKPGANPEAPLIARSETRFLDPRGPAIEFQVDASGAVTGLVLEQGPQRTSLKRQ